MAVKQRVAERLALIIDRRSKFKSGGDLVQSLSWIWCGLWRRDLFFGVSLFLYAAGSGLYSYAYLLVMDDIQRQHLANWPGFGWWILDPSASSVRPPILYITAHWAVVAAFVAVVWRSRCRVSGISLPIAVLGNLAILWLVSLDAGAHLVPGATAIWPSTSIALGFVNYNWIVVKLEPQIEKRPRVRFMVRKLLLLGILTSMFMAYTQIANSKVAFELGSVGYQIYAAAGLVDFAACVFLALHAVRSYRWTPGTFNRGRSRDGLPDTPSPPPGRKGRRVPFQDCGERPMIHGAEAELILNTPKRPVDAPEPAFARTTSTSNRQQKMQQR